MENSLIDELEMHRPAVTDAATLKRYRQDLAVSKFLSGLSPSLRSQGASQKLGGDIISTLDVTFSRVSTFLLKLMRHLHHLLSSLP